LHLIFGLYAGIHLEIVLHLAVAWAGGYVLGRTLGLNRLGSIGCAALFPSSSWFYLHLAVGHLTFLPYTYLPWILALVVLSINRRRLWLAALAASLLALSLGEGGAIMFVNTFVFLTILTLALAAANRSLRPLVTLGIVAVFAISLGAVKLLPSIAFSHSRQVDDQTFICLSMFGQMLFSRNQEIQRDLAGAFWGYHEYGAYLGIPFAMLAVLGVIYRPRAAFPWVVVLLAMLSLCAGDFGRFSPWPLLHRLPLFDSLRVPSRWTIFLIAAIGPLVGLGIEGICGNRPWRTMVAGCVLLFAVTDAWLVSSHILTYPDAAEPPAVAEAIHFQQLWDDNDRHMTRIARANMGALNCIEILADSPSPARGSNQVGYRGEQYLLGSGSVSLTQWTPNRINYDVVVPAATVMVVNQNYARSWYLVRGSGEVFDSGGLLSIRLQARNQHLELVYRDDTFGAGLAITMLAIAAMIILFWMEVRYRGPSRDGS
jgi:hypothetical protein